MINNLVEFINNDELSELDPLIKMVIIHHQLANIHFLYDGNCRTGWILNILYLVAQGFAEFAYIEPIPHFATC
ncbi:Fic family protein [Lonepinella sp. MS14434]|uniref:Fic family protein n=1 Tax=Lonepinella sp. MS14434 TaxID=3003617 RepID=UPI0036DEF533